MTIETNRTERARLDFVGGLMAYNSTGIGARMIQFYEDHKQELDGELPDINQVADLMEPTTAYKFGAFFERYNHAQMFQTLLDIIKRQEPGVTEWLDSYNQPGALGSLELDPALAVPRYYRNLEIHTQPGSYHGPYAGILYHWMIGPFLVHRDDDDGMGWALAKGVPQKDYRRILDLGCGVGKSTFPYCDLYPDAEVIGLDYAAPMLKYGHKLAESRGKKVRFVQGLAEDPGFEDESFDLITAIWLFHEIPKKAMEQTVREAYRLLRPGGVFAIMESPPFTVLREQCSPLSEFLLDSTGRRMSDPYIPMFFSLDRTELVRSGGFQTVREEALPNALTGWGSEDSYFFGAFPWWMTMGEKT
jgi:SAM-dependent methyltransferase